MIMRTLPRPQHVCVLLTRGTGAQRAKLSSRPISWDSAAGTRHWQRTTPKQARPWIPPRHPPPNVTSLRHILGLRRPGGARGRQDTSQVTDCKFLGPGFPSLTTSSPAHSACPFAANLNEGSQTLGGKHSRLGRGATIVSLGKNKIKSTGALQLLITLTCAVRFPPRTALGSVCAPRAQTLLLPRAGSPLYSARN